MAHLKLTDCDLRDILRGRPHGFVADINPVHLNASRSSEMPRERDRRESILGGVEIGAVLNLDAWFELREIKKVSPVDRKVFNLLSREYSLHRRLFRVHGNRGALHRHHSVL